MYFCTSVQLVTEGVFITPGNSEMKISKISGSFLLTAVQQMQLILTLHCPKLVQNIKIRISCDGMYIHSEDIYNRVYFYHFHHLEFETSGSPVAPNPTSFKN